MGRCLGLGFIFLCCAIGKADLDPNFVVVDENTSGSHGDLSFPFVNGAWEPHVLTGFYCCTFDTLPVNKALIVANELTYVQRLPSTPGFAEYDFIGVAEGEYFWQMNQSNLPGQLFLGWRMERGIDGQTPVAPPNANNWTAWDPDGPGPDQTSFWTQIQVLDVRGPGEFSVWQSGPFGDVRAFVASSDGLDASDAFRLTVGSHIHAHLGFTQPGRYEIDMQARTFDAGNNELLSPVITFNFEARVPGCSNDCGDIDGSGTLDMLDIASLQRCIGAPLNESADCSCSNLDASGAIDVDDLAAFVQAWDLPATAWPCGS